MKVESTKGTGIGGIRRSGKSGKTGGSEFSKLLDETAEAGQAAGPSGVQPVDSVLSVQEVGDREGGRRRARERADLLLDRLEDIRHGLLIGAIPHDRLQELATAMRQQRETIDDPQLKEILDEIELRARVELAKFERSV
ncbi:MAG: flagellar assembly protein FliX [Thalassobaculum sp.]|uniref:flagellar assembly protein FliX n=1 Tax=Thalassobaculum sp. TaxID=2022740 RepID=UPI0032ED9008